MKDTGERRVDGLKFFRAHGHARSFFRSLSRSTTETDKRIAIRSVFYVENATIEQILDLFGIMLESGPRDCGLHHRLSMVLLEIGRPSQIGQRFIESFLPHQRERQM